MFWIIGWVTFGLIAGIIARALYPGPQAMGLFRTMLLGIGGSLLGGGFGYQFMGGSLLQGAGWIGSIVGAVGLIAYRQWKRIRIKSPSGTY